MYNKQNPKIIKVPVTYAGKLPVAKESDFVLNYDREKVEPRNSKTVSVEITYGGKLPVGKERP